MGGGEGGWLPDGFRSVFEALGVTLLNGWGLTETSPVLACTVGLGGGGEACGCHSPRVATWTCYLEALGVTLLNGWGLTETSPMLACRR